MLMFAEFRGERRFSPPLNTPLDVGNSSVVRPSWCCLLLMQTSSRRCFLVGSTGDCGKSWLDSQTTSSTNCAMELFCLCYLAPSLTASSSQLVCLSVCLFTVVCVRLSAFLTTEVLTKLHEANRVTSLWGLPERRRTRQKDRQYRIPQQKCGLSTVFCSKISYRFCVSSFLKAS